MQLFNILIAILSSVVMLHARPARLAVSGMCFEPFDCLITGNGLVACSREGNNAVMGGLFGTCVVEPAKKPGRII